MRSLRQLAVVIAALFLQLLPIFADDVITNVMSPVVGYQYYDSLEHAGTNSMVTSPIVSFQYFDWPDRVSVNFLNSPKVSYYYQFATSPIPVTLHGQVTDANGAPLANVAVLLYIGALPTILTNTDANGYYQFPVEINGGNYSLLVSKIKYQGQMRSLTLNANTAKQDFQLKPMPPPPDLLLVSRSSAVNYTSGDIMGSVLRIFDGSTFVPVDENHLPSLNLKTIVMTHGWVNETPNPSITNTSFDRWPVNMAVKLQSQGITPATANILAWDWRYAASATSCNVGAPTDRTSGQGVALGETLQHRLGVSYSKPLHFLGHSLGTLVNASAINYLHGVNIGTRGYSLTPWTTNLVHVTLFDQAQLAELLAGTSPIYQSALPLDFTWSDNYKSLVGLGDFADAVNVNLQKGVLTTIAASLNPIKIVPDSHSYPVDWYGLSINLPLDAFNPLGFKRSYEYAPFLFPPSDIINGNTYHQAPLNYDELALEPVTGISSLGLLPDVVLQTTKDTFEFTSGVTVQIVDTAQNYASSFFNYVSDVASQGGQAVVSGLDSSSSLGLFLTTGVLLPTQLAKNNSPRPMGTPNGNDIFSTPPMAWLPIQFPTNAMAMAFDFMAEGNPMDDVLVCGVGTNNLFSLEAKYIPADQISASRLIDVSVWAGTTNELFFGFMGGTSTNATLQIQNIRFYSLQQPQLVIEHTNNLTFLAWPSTAGGYSITTTTNLTKPDWETVTNIPTVLGNSYFLTNFWPDQTRFFRLQQQ